MQNKEHPKNYEDSFWADQFAEDAIARVENNKFLKDVVKKRGFYVVMDEKTPSGTIHIGSGRGWVIHDAIAKALRDKGVKAKFILSSDDLDPLDKPSKELSNEDNEKYIGVPFKHIPSPVEGYKNFGDYYFRQCTNLFPEFGIEAELESTGEEYEKGSFNKTIKIALDNADKIQKIYKKLYGDDVKAGEKLPFNVLCPQCKKISTTLAIEWNKEKEELYFECRNDVVEWAKGCGYKGWISPYNGNGKFPWKVEWAAKWPTNSVIVETAGKDHFTKGGSRTAACHFAMDVFDYPPPYPSDGYETGPGYEFFTVGGKKMSTSKGHGLGFADSINYAPAKMLRFLLIRTRPNAVIDFDPYSNDLILLYERYDQAERVYFGKEDMGEKENIRQKRIYELSHVGKIPQRIPPQVSLSQASMLVQIFDNEKMIFESLRNTGQLPEDATKPEIEYVKERLKFAKKWVEEFADEQYKFILQKEINRSLSLSEQQKQALRILASRLKELKWTEKTLFNEFYRIANDEVRMNTPDLFKAAYLVLLNKERGPKLAPFILALGKEKVAEMLEKV